MKEQTSTEEKIITAATGIFLQKGKDGARMQEIADYAGINKALLHYYFRSKDRLYDEVFKRELKKFFTGIFTSVKDTEDAKIFIRSFINLYTDRIAKNQNLVHFIISEIEKGGASISSVIVESMQKNKMQPLIITNKIQDAIAKKQLRNIDPVNLMISLIGLCLYPFLAKPILEKTFLGVNVTSPEFLARRKKEVFDLVWNGIKYENEK
ncbi:MAG TPA: TetR/AcrR family transcriptional regulator [Bacteroidetes bacterium]|nr:TetR/AcrR family transcriptional regulator [Bacteroidota bacterium]